MTHAVCPKCGEKIPLYGKNGGIEDLSGVKKISSMPVLLEDDLEGFLRQGNAGTASTVFMELADRIVNGLKKS